jgi:hypothetical protein
MTARQSRPMVEVIVGAVVSYVNTSIHSDAPQKSSSSWDWAIAAYLSPAVTLMADVM